MKRIKRSVLGAFAALALTAALGASVASASSFTAPGAGGATTTLTGTPAAGVSLTLGGDTMKCNEATLTAGTLLGESQEDITFTPQLSKCGWFGFSLAWTINECKFRFHSGAILNLPRSLDITGCSKPMTFNFSGCQLEIGNQNRVGSITYSTGEAEGVSVVSAAVSLEGLTYTRSGSCMSSLQGTFYDGKLNSEWTIKGKNSEGKPRPVGVELTSAPTPSVFSVEETPASISGTRTNASNLGMLRFGPAGTLSCKTQTLSGSQSSATATTLTLTPSFSSCKFNGVEIPNANFEAGGCNFVFHLNFTVDIAGETCESKPMVVTRPGCLAVVGPQTGLFLGGGPSTLLNSGSGRTRSLTIQQQFLVESMKVTLMGPNCGKEGAITNGWIQAFTSDRTPTLTATNSGGKPQGLSVE